MERGGLVSFIADQNAGDRGLFVPFFGRLASTYKSIGLMAMRFEAPIICSMARRMGGVGMGDGGWRMADGEGDNTQHTTHNTQREAGPEIVGGFGEFDPANPLQYRIEAPDIIMPEEWKGRPDPLFYISARYRRAIESMVRRAPEQNLWLHRYWKSRPRFEHLGRPFPAGLREKLRGLPWMTEEELGRIEEWSARDAADLASRPRKVTSWAGREVGKKEARVM